jgi:hypothetical protein
MRGRTIPILVAETVLATLLAGPAVAAGACTYETSANPSLDYATTRRLSGTCAGVKARHKYDPVWSPYDYWTPWDYDATFAYSWIYPELLRGEHGYFNEA